MGWFIRSSRSGMHMVYSQQAENSCGIACIIMVNFKMKKWQLAAAANTAVATGPVMGGPVVAGVFRSAIKAEEEVYKVYAKVTGRPYDGSIPSDCIYYPAILNNLGIGIWRTEYFGNNQLAHKVKTWIDRPFAPPIILLVHWRGGAGHFVVCDAIFKDRNQVFVDVCDPWDGAVRTVPLTEGLALDYRPKPAGPSFDFGQSHKNYSNTSIGTMDGWAVRQV